MSTGSIVVVREYFTTGDPRFLEELFACQDHAALAGFAPMFFGDLRPWARAQLERYIDDGCDRPFHRALVKRVFKAAERADDAELVARFAVAFDRLVSMELRTVKKRFWGQGRREVQILRRKGSYPGRRIWYEPKSVQKWKPPSHGSVGAQFSLATRQHLRRRALRFLRKLGPRDPERFLDCASLSLRLYEDAHFDTGADIPERFALVNLLFQWTPVLYRTSRKIFVTHGRSLADLQASLLHEHLWLEQPERVEQLLPLCRALLVRRALLDFYNRAFPDALDEVPFERLRPLLESEHPDLQAFGIERLKNAEGLERVSVDDWLRLLQLEHPELLPIVVQQIEAHVSPSRLTEAQKMAMAVRPEVHVAQLGLRWLIEANTDLDVMLQLRHATCPGVRAEAALWLADAIEERGSVEQLREMLDARHDDMRCAAQVLLEHERFRDETRLWLALAESPYPEMQALLTQHLEERRRAFAGDGSAVHHLWATSLLSIHGGSRTKRRVLRQIADRIGEDPGQAEALLPLLRISLRSVRPSERGAGLAAIARLAFTDASFAALVATELPELDLGLNAEPVPA